MLTPVRSGSTVRAHMLGHVSDVARPLPLELQSQAVPNTTSPCPHLNENTQLQIYYPSRHASDSVFVPLRGAQPRSSIER